MQNLKSSGFHSDDELFEGNPKGLKKLINNLKFNNNFINKFKI